MSTITKPKKYLYRIQYVDNSYQIVEWTKQEFERIGKEMTNGKLVSTTDDGIFRLHDIRTIVYLPPTPEPTEEEKAEMKNQAENQLSEWGFVDPETAAWLKSNGIDITGGDK